MPSRCGGEPGEEGRRRFKLNTEVEETEDSLHDTPDDDPAPELDQPTTISRDIVNNNTNNTVRLPDNVNDTNNVPKKTNSTYTVNNKIDIEQLENKEYLLENVKTNFPRWDNIEKFVDIKDYNGRMKAGGKGINCVTPFVKHSDKVKLFQADFVLTETLLRMAGSFPREVIEYCAKVNNCVPALDLADERDIMYNDESLKEIRKMCTEAGVRDIENEMDLLHGKAQYEIDYKN